MNLRITESHKLAEIEAREHGHQNRKPFGAEWAIDSWAKWATIKYAFERLGLREGATVLDVGAGSGWTSLFLAECGYEVSAIDISPVNVETTLERASRSGVGVTAKQADMDELDLPERFDAALIFDALHHSTRQADVIRGVARHLKPGGWLLVGEPSVLHFISPRARRVTREVGWVERGISIRGLKRDCRTAGLGAFRRFYEGSQPTAAPRDSIVQLVKLAVARIAVAPQHSVWLAARKAL